MNKQTIYSLIASSLMFLLIDFSSMQKAYCSEQEQSDKQTEMAKLIDFLSMPINEQKEKKIDLDKVIAKLGSMGDEVINPMMEKVHKNKNDLLQYRCVKVLRSIGTSNAQQALLDIALKKDSHWAAINYIETLRDKSDARKLLISTRPDILSSALYAIRGIELDKELLEKLRLFTQSLDPKVRTQAAGVIGAEPSGKYAVEKVDALIDSIKTTDKVKDGHKKLPNPQAIGTVSDDVYFQIIDALSKAKGIDELIKYKTSSLEGKTQYCVLIARANRGDPSVKQHLYKIIEDPNAGMLKCSAVIAFNYIGSVDDIPFLRKLSLSDSLSVEPPQQCFVSPHDPLQTAIQNNKFYPVRFWAQQAIQWIEKKAKMKTDR